MQYLDHLHMHAQNHLVYMPVCTAAVAAEAAHMCVKSGCHDKKGAHCWGSASDVPSRSLDLNSTHGAHGITPANICNTYTQKNPTEDRLDC